jgi:hypothetical protein
MFGGQHLGAFWVSVTRFDLAITCQWHPITSTSKGFASPSPSQVLPNVPYLEYSVSLLRYRREPGHDEQIRMEME